MDRDTLIRTITALIVAILDMASVLGLDVHPSQDSVLAVVTLVVGVWVYYYNNDITTPAQKTTRLMRAIKKQIKAGNLTIIDKLNELLEECEEDD